LSVANPQRVLPPHRWDAVPDPMLPPLHLVGPSERATQLRHIMSSSFAFGGSNAVVVLGRE
jgi:3-oxoacyl-[acyl-carrier-protein] synthase-1